MSGGFDPHDRDLYFGGTKCEAAERLRSRLQDEFDERERVEAEKVTTLVTGAKVTGVVVHGVPGKTPAPGLVVVIPNLHSRYLWAVTGAAVVISEKGGGVAHLVQVSREQSIPVVRAERARERWGEGDVVEVDPEGKDGARHQPADRRTGLDVLQAGQGAEVSLEPLERPRDATVVLPAQRGQLQRGARVVHGPAEGDELLHGLARCLPGGRRVSRLTGVLDVLHQRVDANRLLARDRAHVSEQRGLCFVVDLAHDRSVNAR